MTSPSWSALAHERTARFSRFLGEGELRVDLTFADAQERPDAGKKRLALAPDHGPRSDGLTVVPASTKAMEAYIVTALAERDDGRSLPFVVRDEAGAVVGTTRFMEIEHWQWVGAPPAEPLPEGPDAVEIGFTWYAERVQRTAVNTEAKLLLCTHAFERWKVRRVTWKTDERNVRSRAAILRLGARFDGILRAHRPGADGKVRSTAFFSMLAEEWPDARRALIEKLESRL
jgi:RimJ/RimL family protein N-acetyltransferase